PLEIERLNRAFERTWDGVAAKFEDIATRAKNSSVPASTSEPKRTTRSDEDVLAEVLDRVRAIERGLLPPRVSPSPPDGAGGGHGFGAGERVISDKFGAGEVMDNEGSGRNMVVKADFGSAGVTRLVPLFNTLQRL